MTGKKVEIGVDAIKIQILKVYYALDSILDSRLLTLFKSISAIKRLFDSVPNFCDILYLQPFQQRGLGSNGLLEMFQ